MGRILDYIAHETNGKCFTSFKYCYDDSTAPNIEYGSSHEDSYINSLKRICDKSSFGV